MKTKILKILASAALTLTLQIASIPAMASGGVSDGGGGTTNPNPVDPQLIVQGASTYAAKVLLVWLNAEEANFSRLSDAEKAASPMRKLFQANPNIFTVVKNAQVEMRMSEPCYDKNGTTWDGSIYASQPGAICLSPFSMAPKLNKTNVYPETIALLIHELSHLMGTTEEEAREIQQRAFSDLSRMDMPGTLVTIDFLINSTIPGTSILLDPALLPSFRLRPVFIQEVGNDFARLFGGLTFHNSSSFKFLNKALEARYWAQFSRIGILGYQACADDVGETDEMRMMCFSHLEKAFSGKSHATAQEIEFNLGRAGNLPGFDDVVIYRPNSPTAVAGEMKALQVFLKGVLAELVDLKNSKIEVYLVSAEKSKILDQK